MALNQNLKDAASVLAERIGSGQGAARTSLGGDGTAFGWMGGTIRTVADYASTASTKGMDFKYTLVSDDGSASGPVAPGVQKPEGAALSSGVAPLQKFARRHTWTLEQAIDATGLAGAIGSVLQRKVLKDFEGAATLALDSGSGGTVSGADWVGATAAAQAEIVSNGGSPSVLVLSPGDYEAFVKDVTSVSAFSQSPDSPVGALLGTPCHLSPNLAAGTAYVFDSSAVMCVQQEDSPMITVDTVSMSETNQARLVLDLIATTFVADSALVVKVTAPTPPA